MPLRQVLQIVQQAPGARCLRIVADPDFRQTVMWRQLTNTTTQVLPLHCRLNAVAGQYVKPHGGDGEVGSMRDALHGYGA